jgi:uncharacterized SAM-binding protein YcdF (DUF218 family)
MYIVSKIIGDLIDPLLWIVLTLIWASLSRSAIRRIRLLSLALTLTLIFSNGWLIKNLTAAWQWKPEILQPENKYEVGVLLGGLSGYDKLDHRGYFNHASDRFIQTLRLYKTGHIQKILITGGQASPFPDHDLRESDFLTESFVEMGVTREHIINERNARNTIENAKLTRMHLDSMGTRDSVLLITSAAHMPRSARIFTEEHIPFRAYPCDYYVKPSGSRFSVSSLKPSTDAFVQWKSLLHEMTGYAWVLLKYRG